MFSGDAVFLRERFDTLIVNYKACWVCNKTLHRWSNYSL